MIVLWRNKRSNPGLVAFPCSDCSLARGGRPHLCWTELCQDCLCEDWPKAVLRCLQTLRVLQLWRAWCWTPQWRRSVPPRSGRECVSRQVKTWCRLLLNVKNLFKSIVELCFHSLWPSTLLPFTICCALKLFVFKMKLFTGWFLPLCRTLPETLFVLLSSKCNSEGRVSRI